MFIHAYFEKNVLQTPHAIAVQYEDNEPLTYLQLNQRSNQLAHYLRSRSITVGDAVAVSVHRSVDQVVIFLALSKMGAIYVPIAPAQNPYNLFQDIILNCSPKLVVGNRECIENMQSVDASRKVYVETIAESLAEMSSANIEAKIESTDVAYIAHSSGTTGKPKAIPIQHAGLEYWAHVQETLFTDMGANSRVLAFISIGFDAHVWEYLMTWVKGASLHIPNSDTVVDGSSLVKFISGHAITHATLIPTVIRTLNLSDSLPILKNSGLTSVYSTGESCTQEIVKIFQDHGVKLWNCYGPTELTFGITACPVIAEMLDESGAVPIGKPFGDEIKMHVLTPDQIPCDDGELYIESPYLTPGYLNPQDNVGRIVETIVDGRVVRLFKTGDHVFRLQGHYYCKGRLLDAHVKINGQLVEIVGVENILRGYPGIRDAALIVYENRVTHQNQLVAYYAADNQISATLIKQHLRSRVSGVSVPSQFIFKKNLPCTLNGKIDRRILIDEFQRHDAWISEPHSGERETRPKNSIENTICGIWHSVLTNQTDAFSEIDTDLDYESLGGNSINLIYMRDKIEAAFQISVAMNDLYPLNTLTLNTLANLVWVLSCMKHSHRILETVKGSAEPGVFFIPPITGFGMVYSDWIARLKTTRSIHILYSPGLFLEGIVPSNIESIAKLYINIIKEKQPHGPYALVGWSFGGVVAWEIAVQCERLKEPVDFLCIVDSVSPWMNQNLSSQDYYETLVRLVENLPNVEIDSRLYDAGRFHHLSRSRQIMEVFDSVRPRRQESRIVLDIVKSHIFAMKRYHPTALSLVCPYIFSSEETQQTMQGWGNAAADAINRRYLGWNRLLKIEQLPANAIIPGDHFTLLNDSSVPQIIDEGLAQSTQNLEDGPNELARLQSENSILRKELNKLLGYLELLDPGLRGLNQVADLSEPVSILGANLSIFSNNGTYSMLKKSYSSTCSNLLRRTSSNA